VIIMKAVMQKKIEFVNKVTHPEVPRRVNANAVFFMQRWEILNMLWKADAVQHAWTYDRSKMNVIDSHFSFLNRMEEIVQPEYVIMTQDVLLAQSLLGRIAIAWRKKSVNLNLLTSGDNGHIVGRGENAYIEGRPQK